MKTIFNFSLGIALLLFTATCKDKQNGLEITGTIQEQGMTSYQYGTHTLTNSETFYAVKSDSLDLDQYIGEEVTVRATKIEGYPLEGGPEFLQILEIK